MRRNVQYFGLQIWPKEEEASVIRNMPMS